MFIGCSLQVHLSVAGNAFLNEDDPTLVAEGQNLKNELKSPVAKYETCAVFDQTQLDQVLHKYCFAHLTTGYFVCGLNSH